MSSLLQHLQATQTGTLRCSLPKLKPKIFLAPYQQMVTCVRQSMDRSHAISKVLILYINSIIVWSDLGIAGIKYLVSIWVHPYSIQHSTVQSSQVYLLAKSGILDSSLWFWSVQWRAFKSICWHGARFWSIQPLILTLQASPSRGRGERGWWKLSYWVSCILLSEQEFPLLESVWSS